MLYLTQLKVPSYPERNFGGNQLLDSSMSLSPLYPDLTSDLHVSIAFERPPRFPLASFDPGKARYLSGPSECAQIQILLTYDQDRVPLHQPHLSWFVDSLSFRAAGFVTTTLAHSVDSLVRVSRRVVKGRTCRASRVCCWLDGRPNTTKNDPRRNQCLSGRIRVVSQPTTDRAFPV